MNPTYDNELRTHINALASMGNALLPVILKRGDESPENGKAPSYIKPNGIVTLITGRSGWSTEQLEQQIALANKHGFSLGLAVQPPEGLVVIDLDVQNYPGGKSELIQDYEEMVRTYPDLENTRIETTRSGGLHIWVRISDLSAWRKPDGGLRKNLCREDDGAKRGELLSSNSICVTAPSYELYSMFGATPIEQVITIGSLDEVGIYPFVKRGSTTPGLQQPPAVTNSPQSIRLRDLLGHKAANVLLGQFAYSDTNSSKRDRSLQLVGFSKEAYGVENLAKELGANLSESADELIKIVIDKFNLHDKADRVLASLDDERTSYTPSRPDFVKQKLGINTTPSRRKSIMTPDLAEAEITKVYGSIRERIRTGEIILGDDKILQRDELETVYIDLCKHTQFQWNSGLARHAIIKLGRQHQYDHIKEHYLDLIDGVTPLPDDKWTRLDQLLLGIHDPIAAMFLPKYLVGAVARLMQPGCPYVPTPVLIGTQGIHKSASAKILFGNDFVADEISNNLDKDDVSRAHEFLCTEIAEMDGLTTKSDRERFKAFLTRTVDTYRPSYGACNVRRKRAFVFWGTSNNVPLNDPTGNRRFVAIDLRSKSKANPIPLAQIEAYRVAIWARAFEEFYTGSSYELSATEQNLVNSQNALFTVTDSWGDRLSRKLAQHPQHTCMTVDDAFTILEIPAAQQTPANQKRLREVLESLDYQMAKVSLPDGRRVSRLTRLKGQKQVQVDVGRCMGII